MKEDKREKKVEKKPKKDTNKEITRDFTVNLHKRLHKIQFKKRGKRAINEILRFASKQMWVKDVRMDTELNHFVWKEGIRDIPNKVRIRISKKKSQDEDAKEPFYCLVQHVDVESFSALRTENAKA
jgi:large subunit ribosomal protein L31e